MADSSQLKRVDSADFGDDDPFAELTKIMGFDPRVPVRSGVSVPPVQSPAVEPAPVARAAPEPDLDLVDEDFSIDLEKELLGDFALDDEPLEAVAAAPSATLVEPILGPAAPAGDDDLDLEFDVAFSAGLEGELLNDRAGPTVAETVFEERMGEADFAAPSHDVDFDAAFATDLEGELLGSHVEPAVAEASFSGRMGERELAASDHQADFDAAFAVGLDGGLLGNHVEPAVAEASFDERIGEPELAAPDHDVDDAAFATDLEGELLGNHVEPAVAEASFSGRMGEPVLAAPDHAADFDAAFATDLEGGPMGDYVEPPVAETRVDERMGEPELAASGHDVDFDAAFATDLEGELLGDHVEPAVAEASFDERMGEPELAALSDDVDFDAAFERDLALDDEPEGFDEPVRLDETRQGDGGQPAGEELSAEDVELIAALGPATMAGQYEDEPLQAEAPRAPATEAGDTDFDVAMADVDMDFSAGSGVEPDRILAYQGKPVQSEPLEAGEIDFDDFDDAVFEEEAVPAPNATPLVSMPAARAPAAEPAGVLADDAASDEHDPEELSLEDELNALLGNSVPRAELARGYDAPPLSASLPEADASTDDDFADIEADLATWDPDAPIAGDEAEQVLAVEASGPTVEAVGPAAEFAGVDHTTYAADAEEDYAGPAYQVAEVEYDEAGYGAARQEPVFLDAEPAQEPIAEDELDFDDNAFHAAFENSLAADEPEEQAVNPYVSSRQMSSQAASAAYLDAAPVSSASDWQPATAALDEDIPEIDTVDVPESAMALADDLEIPELAYEDEVRAAPAFDEFESEFAAVYADQAQSEDTAPRSAETGSYSQADRGYGQRYGEAGVAEADAGQFYAAGIAAAAGAAYASSAKPADRRDFDLDDDFDAADLPGSRAPEARDGFDALDYDDLDEEIALPAYAERHAKPRRRGMLIASIVGGVAVLGGVGAFALSFGGGGGSDVPAIVRADDTPIKVRPENPGGTSVPNQDNKVYETVAGGKGPALPAQPRLISSAEEPVDMAAKVPAPAPASATDTGASAETMPLDDERVADLPSGDDEMTDITAKAEDRVDPSVDAVPPGTDNTEVAAVAPRRVRTMVVRPDGTLVPREEPAPAAAPEPHAAAEAMMETTPAKPAGEPQVTNTTKPTFQAPGAAPVPVDAAKPTKAAAKAETSGTPAQVPVAPSRPAQQPVDVVGEVKPEQVASISQGAAAGEWSMQIASQPSEDAAKSTYQDLARRYANVIGGRGATIVKAEIAGKGTFWRVRVPAGSRNEAISLCESYKSAGGNCFVSK